MFARKDSLGQFFVGIPKGLKVKAEKTRSHGFSLTIGGAFGSCCKRFDIDAKIFASRNFAILLRPNSSLSTKSMIEPFLAAAANMAIGASLGFSRTIHIDGLGYKFELRGKVLCIRAGFTRVRTFQVPRTINALLRTPQCLLLHGVNKEHIGLFSSKVRAVRPSEPYKGKGLWFGTETVIRKQGKKTR